MSYTLERFAADCRAALEADPGAGGLEAVRRHVEAACRDSGFVAAHLGPDNDSPRKVLYEDPDLGFCILAHVHDGARTSPPHDHGPSWAVYGQAEGVTWMTDWRCLRKPEADRPGEVEAVRTYELRPGMARAYAVGDLHSPRRDGATRLVRVEGVNMDGVPRDAYMVAPARAAE